MRDKGDKKGLKMYPVIDPGCCILCEGCVEIAPEIFRLNRETGLIEVIDLSRYPKDLVDEAIKICPEDCISWET
jgi:ferredoxin